MEEEGEGEGEGEEEEEAYVHVVHDEDVQAEALIPMSAEGTKKPDPTGRAE